MIDMGERITMKSDTDVWRDTSEGRRFTAEVERLKEKSAERRAAYKEKFKAYAPFDVDGRCKAEPPQHGAPPGSMSLKNSRARDLIDGLWRHGMSCHSHRTTASGTSAELWALIAWCDHNARAYELDANDGGGMTIFLDSKRVVMGGY